jgi:uncharacterized protein YciI
MKIRPPFILLLSFFIFFNIQSLHAQDQLFIVFLNTNPEREQLAEDKVAALQKGHLENIQRLYDKGDLLLAGPFNGGGGIFVLKAADLETARDLLASDPAISANRFRIETLPMQIDKGMICSQEEPYDMILFNFIHFSLADHEGERNWDSKLAYDDKEDVVFAFSYDDGHFVEVLEGDSDAESYANQHPLVQNKSCNYEIRPWWSTNKTFCSDKSKKLNY